MKFAVVLSKKYWKTGQISCEVIKVEIRIRIHFTLGKWLFLFKELVADTLTIFVRGKAYQNVVVLGSTYFRSPG